MSKTSETRTGGLTILLAGVAGLLLLAGGYLWLLGGTAPPRPAVLGGAWNLTRADGHSVTDRDFRGRFLLIYFGYTQCPDICPATLDAVGAAMHQLGPKAARLQPLFISVDPARDTPAVVGRYVGAFGGGLIGLTGTESEIRHVQQEYRVESRVHRAGADPTIDHTAVLFLVGPDGRTLAPLSVKETPDELAARLTPYLS